MKIYAARIQSDIRNNPSERYQEYPSPEEYDRVWHPEIKNRAGLQDGFHECVNFKNFNGKIQGYLPPKPGGDSDWIDDDEFCLIFVTNKSKISEKEAREKGLFDSIIGIQIGCKTIWYEDENEWDWYERENVPYDLQEYLDEHSIKDFGKKGEHNLHYHYECLYENSILFDKPISNAANIIFPPKEHNNHVWGVNAVRQIKINPERVLKEIEENLNGTSQWNKWNQLKDKISK